MRARRPLSLTTRVMIAVALAIGLSLLVIGHLVQNAVERHFAEQDAGELVVMTSAVERALANAGNDVDRLAGALSHAISGHHGVYFQVWSMDGNLIYGPDGAEFVKPINEILADTVNVAVILHQWQADGKTYRGTITQTKVGAIDYRIVTAIDMNFHIQFLDSFHRSLLFIMTLAGIITLLAAWYGVHQGHAPLRGLSDTIRDVQADRLHVRLDPEALPSELQNLATSFNRMIGRLEDSFTRMSHFSADIAHELRTPLTNLITQTQVALGKARSLDEYRELLYSNLEEQERLAKMVNDMLWLAQSEHGLLKPIPESLDLTQEVGDLFDFFEALAEEKQIKLILQGRAPSVQGDRAMLRRAISNLLSNAIRYTTAGDRVLVRLDESENGRAQLSVQNPGPNITAEHLSRIFERFYRIDPSRKRQSEGAGLGLAIVRSIMEAHGGKVEATSGNGISTFKLAF